MSGRKTSTTSRKAVRPAYDNKAVAPSVLDSWRYVRIRVVRAHDGLEEGAILSRPRETAEEMQKLGLWTIID